MSFLKIALKHYKILYGKNSPKLIPVLTSMAEAGAKPPKYRPDQNYLKRAMRIASDNFDDTSVEYADQIMEIAWTSFFFPPAVATGDLLRDVYEIYRTQPGPTAPKVGTAAFRLGVYHARREEFEDAKRFLLEALDIIDPSDAELRNPHIEVRQFMWGMLQDREMTDEATDHLLAIGKMLESDPDSNRGLPISRIAPIYPASALNDGITGYVNLKFTVNEEGFVVDPEVVEFTGSEAFIPAAIQTVLKFRYIPRFVDGKAVAQHDVKSRITFEIKK